MVYNITNFWRGNMNKEEIILKIKEKEEEKDKIIKEINELKEKLRIISNKESNNLTRDESGKKRNL